MDGKLKTITICNPHIGETLPSLATVRDMNMIMPHHDVPELRVPLLLHLLVVGMVA